MPAEHAPPGGITIRGVNYVGGQFIPGDVVDDLSDAERDELDAARDEPEEEPEDEPEPDEEDEEPEDEEEPEPGDSWKDPDKPPPNHTVEMVYWYLEHKNKPLQSGYNRIVSDAEDLLVQIRNYPDIDFSLLSDEAQENVRELYRVRLGEDPESLKKFEKLIDDHPELTDVLDPVLDQIRESPRYKMTTNPAGFLENDYFEADTVEERVENVQAICEGDDAKIDSFFFDSLSDDAKESIAEDIQRHFSRSRSNLFESFDGTESILPILKLAMDKSAPGKPTKFNPKKKSYRLHEFSGNEHDDFVRSAVNYLGKTWESPDGSLALIEEDRDTIQEAGIETESEDFDDEDALRKVWAAIGTYTVSHVDVPASAKNYGTTSGGIGSQIEKDWDSNSVDVYAQLSPNWFVLRRGNNNPEIEKKAKYEIVERSKKPMTLSLPEPYWSDLTDTEPYEQDFDKHELQQDRIGDAARRVSAKRKWSQVKKEVGQLKAEHAKASNLIKSAEAHAEATQTIWHTFSSVVANDDVDDFDTALQQLSESAGSLDESADDIDIDTSTPTAGGEKPAEFNEMIDERAEEIQMEASSQKKATASVLKSVSQHLLLMGARYDNAITIGENALKSVQEELDNPESNPEDLTEHAEQIENIQTTLTKLKTQKNRLSRLKLA